MSMVSWKYAVTVVACVVTAAAQNLSVSAFANTTARTTASTVVNSTNQPVQTANSTSRNPVQICDDLQSSYWNASYSYKPTSCSTTVVTSFYNYTIPGTTTTYSCTSTCDETAPFAGKICYADSKTILTTSLDIHTGFVTETSRSCEKYPGPSPTCSVGLSDCVSLWSSFKSADKEWSSADAITPPPPSITASPVEPFCATCKANKCTIDRASADLYFWPPAANATSRNMCASMPQGTWASRPPDFPNTTWTEVTTGPYAVVNGNTFYSGNVYISIASIEAHWPCQSTLTRYNSIMTLASSDVHTMRGYPLNNIPWAVNYADFQEPVPYSAWYGHPECNIRLPPCSVVFPGEYRPQLVMPAAIRQFDPAWADCSLGFFGLHDPPIALKSVGNFLPSASSMGPAEPIVTPSDPPASLSTPATPADPPVTPTAQPTSSPGNPQDPSEPSDPEDPPSDPNDPSDPPNNPNDPNNPDTPPANPPTNPSNPGNQPSNPNNPENPPNNPPNNPNNPGNPPNSPGSPPNNGQPGPTTPPSNPNPGAITITNAPGGPILADPTGGIIINPGTTLQPGDAPIIISGTTISAAPTGVIIIDPTGTRTLPFQITSTGASQVTITAGGSTLVANPEGIVVAPGTTLRPGDPPVVISGTTLSAAPTGVVVIGPSGTQTIPFENLPGQMTITAGDSTLLAGPSGIVVAPGTTLYPGDAPLTIDGITLSIGPSGIVVVGTDGGTRTIALPTGSGTTEITLTLANGHVVTATSANGQVVVQGVTLSPDNPVATLPGGEVVSLGSSGVVLGTGTRLSTAVFADPTGSGTGTGAVGGGGGGPTGFPGKGSSIVVRWEGVVLGIVSVLLVVVL